MTNKIWKMKDAAPDRIEIFKKELGISEITAQILLVRGINDIKSARNFIEPHDYNLHDPFLLSDMDRAVEVLIRTREDQDRVLIYGDYDVDGMTSTALLVRFLRSKGFEVDYIIPHRIEDGYGLSEKYIEKARNEGVKTLITLDCGISDYKQIKKAVKQGMEVVVIDHHQPLDRLPPASAVIDPLKDEDSYPFKELAGVGVAFKFIQALEESLEPAFITFDCTPESTLDLVALGTIADLVPLRGENRNLVKFGLDKLNGTERTGLKALIDICGLEKKELSTGQVGFQLAPRLNAAGRINAGSKAVELLLTDSKEKAHQLAAFLDNINRERQNIEESIYQKAICKIEKEVELKDEKVIVLAERGWHVGVIGIAASRLLEEFNRPVILISVDEDGVGQGSGRSISKFNLFEALSECEDCLLKFGGHKYAAGLSAAEEQIKEFKERINNFAEDKLEDEDLIPEIYIDKKTLLSDLNESIAEEINLLKPFGFGNPRPVLAAEKCRVSGARRVGKTSKHLQVDFYHSQRNFKSIGFNMGEYWPSLTLFNCADVAFTPEINEWQGEKNLQLRLKDLKVNRPSFHPYADDYQNYNEKLVVLNALAYSYSMIISREITLNYIFKDRNVLIVMPYISLVKDEYRALQQIISQADARVCRFYGGTICDKEDLIKNLPAVSLTTREFYLENIDFFSDLSEVLLVWEPHLKSKWDKILPLSNKAEQAFFLTADSCSDRKCPDDAVFVDYSNNTSDEESAAGDSFFSNCKKYNTEIKSRNMILTELITAQTKGVIFTHSASNGSRIKDLIEDKVSDCFLLSYNMPYADFRNAAEDFNQSSNGLLISAGVFSIQGIKSNLLTDLFIYDLPWNDVQLFTWLDYGRISRCRVHFLFGEQDWNYNQKVIDQYFPDRKLLTAFYILLKDSSEGKKIKVDELRFKKKLELLLERKINIFTFRYALQILCELKLFDFNQKNQLLVIEKKSLEEDKIALKDSVLYKDSIREKKAFLELRSNIDRFLESDKKSSKRVST